MLHFFLTVTLGQGNLFYFSKSLHKTTVLQSASYKKYKHEAHADVFIFILRLEESRRK